MSPSLRRKTRRVIVLSLTVFAAGCGGPEAVPSSPSPLSTINIDGAPTASAPSPPPNVATPAATIGGIGAGEPWLLHDRYVGDDVKGLFLVRPDGTGDHRILDDVEGDVRAPAWSSDGSRIAFVYRGTGSADDGEIWTAAADGTGAEKLMDGSPDCSGAFYPAWSPDDRRIAFVCYTSDGNGSLAVYDVETADLTRLASIVYPEVLDNPPRWSPDGSTIAFDILHWDPTDQYLDGSLIATIAVDGGSLTRLTTFASFAAYPDWHPDGTALVFNTYDQGNMVAASEPSNLFSIALDGTGLRQLTTASVDGSFRITQPRWDPTEDRIWVTLWRSPDISFGWVDPRTGAVSDLGVSGSRPQPRP